MLLRIVIGTGLPLEATYALAAVVAGAGSLVRPIQFALLPAFARTPGELVAANVASSTGEGVGTFAGPLIAGALVAWTGSVSASVVVAAGFAAAAAAGTGLRFERDADARGGFADRSARFRLADAPRVLRRYPSAVLIMGAFLAQVFVRGLLITLIVVASIESLGMGDAGVGLLNASIGLGGLVGALGALALVGGKRLTGVFAIALAGWGIPLVVIGGWPVAGLALAALFVTGVCNSVLDVSGFTLIQRGVQNEDRVTMFGVFEGGLGVSLLVGSLLAPALIAALGARGAFAAAGAILPIVAVLTWRPIANGARRGKLTEELLALLRSNPLFAPLPLTALDRLAEDLVRVAFEPGQMVMRKGEPGDHYLLIADGEVDVSDDGRLSADMRARRRCRRDRSRPARATDGDGGRANTCGGICDRRGSVPRGRRRTRRRSGGHSRGVVETRTLTARPRLVLSESPPSPTTALTVPNRAPSPR